MRKITVVALGIALMMLLSACQKEAGSTAGVVAQAQEKPVVASYVNKDALDALRDIYEAGITPRVHASDTGKYGVVLSQLPLAGDPIVEDMSIDLVIGGNESDVEAMLVKARPVVTVESQMTAQEEMLQDLRKQLGDEYTLDPNIVKQIELDNLDDVANVIDPVADLTETPEVSLRSRDVSAQQGDNQSSTNTSASANAQSQDGASNQSSSQSSAEQTPKQLVVGDPNGPYKFSKDQDFSESSTGKLGVWNVAFPSNTATFTDTVQGVTMTGKATRLADGRVLAMACAPLGQGDNKSFSATVVDQILLFAPVRYGTPIRSGRTEAGEMPAVTSVVNTTKGPTRVITWYGYGELCDITLPMNETAASDKPAYDLIKTLEATS